MHFPYREYKKTEIYEWSAVEIDECVVEMIRLGEFWLPRIDQLRRAYDSNTHCLRLIDCAYKMTTALEALKIGRLRAIA